MRSLRRKDYAGVEEWLFQLDVEFIRTADPNNIWDTWAIEDILDSYRFE